MSHKLIDKKAPSFTLPSSEKKPISLKDYKGQFLVVFFYPKNETTGCTLEVQTFKDKFFDFSDDGVILLGISPDDIKSHCAFIEHHDLPFPLLSDLNHEVAQSYGVWQQKKTDNHEYWGVERTTFVIDKFGKIRFVIQNVKPNDHPQIALNAVKDLMKWSKNRS